MLKEERYDFLWKAIERSIPYVRSRVKIDLPATPITHQHLHRRCKGTYGPALEAGKKKKRRTILPINCGLADRIFNFKIAQVKQAIFVVVCFDADSKFLAIVFIFHTISISMT